MLFPRVPFSHVFSKRVQRVLKNCSCCIHYRFLTLYRILLNFCIWQEDILHYMTVLSESKSVQKCSSYYRAHFFSAAFSKRIDKVFKNYSCCIHFRFLMLLSGPSKLLHLRRGYTALLNSVVRIKIGTQM